MFSNFSAETPCCLVKKLGSSTEFVELTFKPSNTPHLKRTHLLQSVSKEKKAKFGARLDGYIADMRKFDRIIQYYMSVDAVWTVTYIADKYFTLGLKQVEENTIHVIKNEAKSGPIYLYKCSPIYNGHYQSHVNSNKAVINSTWIVAHFDPIQVEPEKCFTLHPHSIYFFYSVTHCMISLQRIGSDIIDNEQTYFISSVQTAEVKSGRNPDGGKASQESPTSQNPPSGSVGSFINKRKHPQVKKEIETKCITDYFRTHLSEQREKIENVADSSENMISPSKKIKVENVID